MLQREQRLRASRDFRRTYKRGKCYSNSYAALYVAKGAVGNSPTRLGISISKKLGGAVVRNRIKRRIRDIFRAHYFGIPSGLDLVVVGRSSLKAAAFDEIRIALEQLLTRAGIWAETASAQAAES